MEQIIPIPGNKTSCRVGNAHRALRLYGADFSGASVDHCGYCKRHARTGVLECLSVSWLEIQGELSNVPAGMWEATLRVRCEHPRFLGDWKIEVEGDEENALVFTHELQRGVGADILERHKGQWMRLSFGVLSFSKTSKVRFKGFGHSPMWCYGIYFGDLELRACGIEWEKERLLILCLMGKASDVDGECLLQELPRELIGLIAQMLITPLPYEVTRPGSLLQQGSG